MNLRQSVLTLLLVGVSANLFAQTNISLTSDPADISSLRVGDMVTINVHLDGLNPGYSLDVLAATVEFDSAILGTPTAIVHGPIVPDETGFLSATGPGLADASYDVSFATSGGPVTDNGQFFSFDLTAAAEGSSDIGISFADALGITDISIGSGLSARVVPEPAGLSLLALGMLCLLHSKRNSR